jgi:hypothetical protein
MTIVFGMSPPIAPSTPPTSSARPPSGLMSLLMARNPGLPSVVATIKPGKADFSEGDQADKARDRRLRERLRRWERDEPGLLNDLPQPFLSSEDQAENGGNPEVIFLGPNGPAPATKTSGTSSSSENDVSSSFFRSSVLVPSTRSIEEERASRVSRRQEINELTMRMAMGAIGGEVETSSLGNSFEETSTPTAETAAVHEGQANGNKPEAHAPEAHSTVVPSSSQQKMWADWGDRIELWSNVRRVADHALGRVVSNRQESKSKATLEATEVPWSTISEQWYSAISQSSFKKNWIQGAMPSTTEEGATLEGNAGPEESIDDIVERLKNDPDLDQHEQRLLNTIVNSCE